MADTTIITIGTISLAGQEDSEAAVSVVLEAAASEVLEAAASEAAALEEAGDIN